MQYVYTHFLTKLTICNLSFHTWLPGWIRNRAPENLHPFFPLSFTHRQTRKKIVLSPIATERHRRKNNCLQMTLKSFRHVFVKLKRSNLPSFVQHAGERIQCKNFLLLRQQEKTRIFYGLWYILPFDDDERNVGCAGNCKAIAHCTPFWIFCRVFFSCRVAVVNQVVSGKRVTMTEWVLLFTSGCFSLSVAVL